ncbi:anti-sigma factor [Rothia uropygialis]|uniref:anti-sigma factor n=1 Tax=Kocuria sp. 36 TaxID=1415402 RepID=UPI00101DB044
MAVDFSHRESVLRNQQQQQRQDELLTDPDEAAPYVSKVRASARLVASRRRTAALFVGSNFTDPGHGRQYQVRLMKDGSPVPDTAFNGGSSVWPTGDVRDADALAVTGEPAGGSQAPTSDVMMVTEILRSLTAPTKPGPGPVTGLPTPRLTWLPHWSQKRYSNRI